MAQLFDCSVDNIALHLKNIFASGELDRDSVSEESSVVQQSIKRHVESVNLVCNFAIRKNKRGETLRLFFLLISIEICAMKALFRKSNDFFGLRSEKVATFLDYIPKKFGGLKKKW